MNLPWSDAVVHTAGHGYNYQVVSSGFWSPRMSHCTLIYNTP